MRQRGILFILAAAALVSLITALSLHQELIQERARLADAEKTSRALDRRLSDATLEVEKLKAAGSAVDAFARQIQVLGSEVREKLDFLADDASTRELGFQTHAAQLEAKVGGLTTGLAEIKGQIATPGTGVLARLEELAKLKDQGTQITAQVASLEAKLKEKEALLQSLAAERDRHAEELRRRDADLSALRKELEAEHKRPAGREALPKAEEKPAPPVPIVTAVEASEGASGVVVLGAGRKGGLDTGHVLSISRDGKPIGRVRIIKVYDDLAGAEVLETAPGETIQVSDRASTGAAPPPAAPKTDLPIGKAPPPPPPTGGTNGAAGK